ncbi:MAG TPA: hypothetical protein VL738_19520 [Dactylosporangium sp.]|nr:hypothetical protein [Dactylosporangium sp.]
MLGAGAGVPLASAVFAFTAGVSELDGLGAFDVFLLKGPVIVLVLMAVGWVAVAAAAEEDKSRWRQWWWVIAAPAGMWVVLVIGAITSGPNGSVSEQRLGWALVVVAMYGAAGVGFTRGAPRVARVLASVVIVAAAPVMVVYDDASQFRWRKATYAAAPQVLPVVPGYTVVAVRGDGQVLDVDMEGPARLWVSVQRCRDCSVHQQGAPDGLTVVDGTFEIRIEAVGPARQWPAPDGVHVRPAGLDELASLPLAPSRESD